MTNSILIIYLFFLTLGLAIYYIVPSKYRYLVLLVFSLASYLFINTFMTIFLVITVITTYLFAKKLNRLDGIYEREKANIEDKDIRKVVKLRITNKKKLNVFFYIIINLLILVGLKYLNFMLSISVDFINLFGAEINSPILKIIVPLGISYYTLQAMGYIIDVFRGKYKAENNILKLGLFVSFFPQLFEGPFGRYDAVGKDLSSGGVTDTDSVGTRVSKGLFRVCWGLFKLFVISYRLGIIVTYVFNNFASCSGLLIILGIICFTIQLYAEFSGLIDIASGVSKVFGVNLAKNFDLPFMSQSVSEFWRRWHISLGTWFKDYVFYPISMSKGMIGFSKKLKDKVSPFWQGFIVTSIALLGVWTLTGLWHGADIKYLFYGLYYLVLMILGNLFEPVFNRIYIKFKWDKSKLVFKLLRIFRTFVLVCIGMLIFRAVNLGVAFSMLGHIFSSGTFDIIGKGIIDLQDIIILLVAIIVLFVASFMKMKNHDINNLLVNKNYWVQFALVCFAVIIILVFGAYGNGYIPPDPIYGGF